MRSARPGELRTQDGEREPRETEPCGHRSPADTRQGAANAGTARSGCSGLARATFFLATPAGSTAAAKRA